MSENDQEKAEIGELVDASEAFCKAYQALVGIKEADPLCDLSQVEEAIKTIEELIDKETRAEWLEGGWKG